MALRSRWLVAGVITAVVVVGGAGVALARSAGDDDEQLTGTELQQASDAALAEVGSGTVVEAEVGDGRAAYEVEVQKADGTTVEVELDPNFGVISTGSDESDDSDSGESQENDD